MILYTLPKVVKCIEEGPKFDLRISFVTVMVAVVLLADAMGGFRSTLPRKYELVYEEKI